MSVRGLLNSTCDVYTLSTSKDSMGGINESYTARLTDLPCRVRLLAAKEQVAMGREEDRTTHRFYFGSEQDFRSTDRIKNVKKFRKGQEVGTDTNNYDVVFPHDVDRMSRFIQCDAALRPITGVSTS